MFSDKQSKFVREVGSVVLGVLIALAIGEAADTMRWKIRVTDSMEALRTELAGNRWNVVERQIYQPCLERRLTQLGEILVEARNSGILPPIDKVGQPGYRLVQSSAYVSSESEGVLSHMDHQQARTVATLYGMTSIYRDWAEREQQSWSTLGLMEGPGGQVSDELLAVMFQAWSHAKSEGKWLGVIAGQTDRLMLDFKVPAGEGAEEWNAEKMKVEAPKYSACKPIAVAGKVLP
ncbi:MAG: hypothetical protein ABIR05_05805 [Luteimonas sp.]